MNQSICVTGERRNSSFKMVGNWNEK